MTAPPGPELSALTPRQREQAWARWEVLRPVVEDGVALTATARAAGVPVRTAQRWLAAYPHGRAHRPHPSVSF